MSEKSDRINPERRSNPEARMAISNSLQTLFMDLKEYASSLGDGDIEALSRQFTPEVDTYVRDLITRMEEARKKK